MTLSRLLLALSAGAAISAPAHAAITDAQVERTAAGSLRVTWAAKPSEAVDVLVAAKPDVAPKALKLVSNDDRDGVHEIPARTERTYVVLRGADGSTVHVAERVLKFEGASNFRDVGGYRTADGKRVKWGVIYRSAELSGLSPADQAFLSELGLKTIVDLRSTSERQAQPTALPANAPVKVVAHDYKLDMSGFAQAFAGGVDAEKARATMRNFYPGVLDSHAEHFRDVFQALLNEEGPVLYHCSAGKDRTGVTTALVLTALGVPRETVVQDYLLSNTYYAVPIGAAVQRGGTAETSFFTRLPPDVAKVFAGVEPEYLQAVFAEIDRKHGSVEGYLKTLGVGPAQVSKLRATDLEEVSPSASVRRNLPRLAVRSGRWRR